MIKLKTINLIYKTYILMFMFNLYNQFGCNDGEFNAMAALWFQLLEGSVRSLFHDPSGNIK